MPRWSIGCGSWGVGHDLIVRFEYFGCHFGPASSRVSAAANSHSKKSLPIVADAVTGRAPLMSPERRDHVSTCTHSTMLKCSSCRLSSSAPCWSHSLLSAPFAAVYICHGCPATKEYDLLDYTPFE